MKNISIGLVVLALFMVIGHMTSFNLLDIRSVNMFVHDFLMETRSNDGLFIMRHITKIGEPVILFPLTGILFFLFFFLRKWKMGMIMAIGLWVNDLLTTQTKLLFDVQRPMEQFIGTSGYSFPSGHVTAVTLVFGMIAIGLIPLLKRYRKVQLTLWTICGLIVTLVCISRLYLNAHWLTDVVGGVLLPVGILCFLVGLGEKIENMGR